MRKYLQNFLILLGRGEYLPYKQRALFSVVLSNILILFR